VAYTVKDVMNMPRISVRTTSGWNNPVSCNTPVRVVKAEIIYTTKAGERKVFGSAVAPRKGVAIDKAWNAACEFINLED
jgi:hypothetical protein